MPWRHRMILLVLAALLCVPSAVVAQDNAESGDRSTLERDTLRTLRQSAQRLERDVRQLPAPEGVTSRTPSQLARQLDARRKPAAVFAWLRDNIRYEPYEGAMRGARGALISRRANDVDQALLARAIFEEAGVKTRFASGDVPDKAWETLGERTFGALRVETGEAVEIATNMREWDVLRPSEHVWLEVEHNGEFEAFDPILAERFGTGYNASPSRSDSLPARAESSFRMSLHSRLDDGQEQVLVEHKGTLRGLMGESITLAFEPDVARDRHVEPILRVGDQKTEGPRIPTDVLERLELAFEIESGGRSYRMRKRLFVKGVTPEFFAHEQQVYGIGVLPGWVGAHWAREAVAAQLTEMSDAVEAWSNKRLRASKRQPDLRFRRALDQFMVPLAAALPPLYALATDRAPLSAADALRVTPVMPTPRIIVTGILRHGSDVSVDYWRGGGELDAVGPIALPRAVSSGLAAIAGFDEEQRAQALFSDITNNNTMGAQDVFSAARSERVTFGTIHARNSERIAKMGVADFYKDLLREHAIQDGELILTPNKTAARGGATLLAWWSITPADDRLRAEAATTYAPAQGTPNTERGVAVTTLLRVGIMIGNELGELLDPSDVAEHVCESTKQAMKLSQAFCAESKLQALPALEACLGEATDGGDLFGAAGSISAGPGGPSREKPRAYCNGEARRTRCGLVVADAMLSGTLSVTEAGERAKNDETDADETSEPVSFCR